MIDIDLTFETYLEAYKKYAIGNDTLLKMLGDELKMSPASTMSSLHNAFAGGLVDHLLRVAKFAVKINSTLPDHMKQPIESLIKVSLLCEIGKVGIYTPCTSEWHKKNQGKMYEFKDGQVSMRVGQRSVYKILSAGVNLSEAEYQAILNHDVITSEDTMVKWHSELLTVLLRQAIELAIIEEKHEQKQNG